MGGWMLARMAAIACALLLPCFAHAAQWSRQYSVDYTLGDNDNRTAARRIALNKLRMLAAAAAGKYVQGDEELVNDKYAQSIHMAAAAIVSIRDVKESMSINAAGQSVLHVTATAAVDDAVLKSRIAVMQHNVALARSLADEDARVAALMKRMSEMNGRLAVAKEAAKTYQLMAERTRVGAEIQTLFIQSRMKFAPGTLKAMLDKNDALAKRNAARAKRNAARAKQFKAEIAIQRTEDALREESKVQKGIAWLKKHFYHWVMTKTVVKTKITDVTHSSDGGYDVTVGVAWNTHTKCMPYSAYRDTPFWKNLLDGGLGFDSWMARVQVWRAKNEKTPRWFIGQCRPGLQDKWIVTKRLIDKFPIVWPNLVRYMHAHKIAIDLFWLPNLKRAFHGYVFDGITLYEGRALQRMPGIYPNVDNFSYMKIHIKSEQLNSISGMEAKLVVETR